LVRLCGNAALHIRCTCIFESMKTSAYVHLYGHAYVYGFNAFGWCSNGKLRHVSNAFITRDVRLMSNAFVTSWSCSPMDDVKRKEGSKSRKDEMRKIIYI
jgi:hypothetical protein